MLFNAKNGTIDLKGAKMEYIRFGSGSKTVVMLPGLGDSLRSLNGMALPMAIIYRSLAKEYKVYMFGRRNNMPVNYSTHDMAEDLKHAMDYLSIKKPISSVFPWAE